MLYYCFARLQPVAAWFLHSRILASHLHAAKRLPTVRLPKSCIYWVSALCGWGPQLRKKKVKNFTLWQLDCCVHDAPACCLAERRNCRLQCVLIAANICEDIPDFHSRLGENDSHFFTQHRHIGRLDKHGACGLQTVDILLPSSCLVHTVNHFVNEWRFFCNCDNLNVFSTSCVFVGTV